MGVPWPIRRQLTLMSSSFFCPSSRAIRTPIDAKVAAAAGLASVSRSNDHARRILVELLTSKQTPAQLRVECAWSLEHAIESDDVHHLMIGLLDDRTHKNWLALPIKLSPRRWPMGASHGTRTW